MKEQIFHESFDELFFFGIVSLVLAAVAGWGLADHLLADDLAASVEATRRGWWGFTAQALAVPLFLVGAIIAFWRAVLADQGKAYLRIDAQGLEEVGGQNTQQYRWSECSRFKVVTAGMPRLGSKLIVFNLVDEGPANDDEPELGSSSLSLRSKYRLGAEELAGILNTYRANALRPV